MAHSLRTGLTKRAKKNKAAAARASAASDGSAVVAQSSSTADFVSLGAVPRRRRLPNEPKVAVKLYGAPVLMLPGKQKFSQSRLSTAVSDGKSSLQKLFAATDKSVHGLTSEMLALVTAPDNEDDSDPYGLGSYHPPEPALSRHRRRRLAQHQRWRDIIDSSGLHHIYLSLKHGVVEPDQQETVRPSACGCAHTRRIEITLADWSGCSISYLDLCQCTSAAERLLGRGYFPCAPKCPSIGFSTALLDFISIHSLHVAPNVTAWADTLESFWSRAGHAAKLTGRFRKRLSAALTWYQALDNRAEARVTVLLASRPTVFAGQGTKRSAQTDLEGRPKKQSRVLEVEDKDAANGVNLKFARQPDTNLKGNTDVDNCQQVQSEKASVTEDHPVKASTVEHCGTRPSARLQQICPLCFGGDRPNLENSPAHVILCLDANFAQKRRRTAETDPELQYSGGRFITQIEIDAMEQELAERRKRKPKRRATSTVGRVGDDVLDNCEQSFLAAQESVTKASKNYYADTGLMALLCRHDRVVWIANMTSPGERQHYALALLRRVGCELPPSWHLGILYDIGCQLARSIEKWGLLEELADRLTFGVSVFHAYGHQWACQIMFHPRKRNGFGLSDGEGCERFWSAIRHLIACLRVSGYHRRIFVLDRQAAAMDASGLWKLGVWLRRRYTETLRRSREAQDLMKGCGLTEDEVAKEWDDLVRTHLTKLPPQNQKAGDKVIDEILIAMRLVDDLKVQIRADRSKLKKNAHKLSTGETSALTAHVDAALSKIESTQSRIASLNASLGTEQCRRLEVMKGNPYLCARVNARALRAKIRQGIVAHKFERRKLERAYRQQILQAKDHSQTKDLVHRHEDTITAQIKKFNDLVDEMAKLAAQGKKPSARTRLPRKLDSRKIFKLEVDDDIWLEDPGLGPQDELSLPRWQTDENVKRGIQALLEQRRCREEIERVESEARSLGQWWQAQHNVMCAAREDTAHHASIRDAVQRRMATHEALAHVWQAELRVANLLERFEGGKAAVFPATPFTIAMPAFVSGDTSTDIDSDDASDAYTDVVDEDDPHAEFLDDLITGEPSLFPTEDETQAACPAATSLTDSHPVDADFDDDTGDIVCVTTPLQPKPVMRKNTTARLFNVRYRAGDFCCKDSDVDLMARRRGWLSGDGLATFLQHRLETLRVPLISVVHSCTLLDVSCYMACIDDENSGGAQSNKDTIMATLGKLVHPTMAHKWLILGHVRSPGHWTLLEIRWQTRSIHFYDSFACVGGYASILETQVRKLLEFCDEFYAAGLDTWSFLWVAEERGVRQTNSYDCGPFVAADAVSLMQSDQPSTMTQAQMQNWRKFMEESVRTLRTEEAVTAGPSTSTTYTAVIEILDSSDDE